MSRESYAYDLQKVMTLGHLSDTILTVSQMKGGNIKGKQYYVNTTYRVPENMRNGEGDAGVRRTTGFSISGDDLASLAAELVELARGGGESHYFVCQPCTGREDRIVLHEKPFGDSPEKCTARDPGSKGDAFVVR